MPDKFARTNRPTVPEIRPNGVYDRRWIIGNLGVSKDAISAAENDGSLKSAPMGRGRRYLGVWLIRWMQFRSTLPRNREQPTCNEEAA